MIRIKKGGILGLGSRIITLGTETLEKSDEILLTCRA